MSRQDVNVLTCAHSATLLRVPPVLHSQSAGAIKHSLFYGFHSINTLTDECLECVWPEHPSGVSGERFQYRGLHLSQAGPSTWWRHSHWPWQMTRNTQICLYWRQGGKLQDHINIKKNKNKKKTYYHRRLQHILNRTSRVAGTSCTNRNIIVIHMCVWTDIWLILLYQQ